MHSPAKILSVYLIEKEYFTLPSEEEDWPLYISKLPDTKDVPTECAAIIDQPSEKLFKTAGGKTEGTKFNFPIQILYRTRNYPEAWEKSNEVATDLDLIEKELIEIDGEESGESFEYLLQDFVMESRPFYIGEEENTKRLIFSFNGRVRISSSS